MKIALLLKPKKNPSEKGNSQAIIFDVNMTECKVKGVENDLLIYKDYDSLLSWAITKSVKEIYIPNVEDNKKNEFLRLGINLKDYKDLSQHTLFKGFII